MVQEKNINFWNEEVENEFLPKIRWFFAFRRCDHRRPTKNRMTIGQTCMYTIQFYIITVELVGHWATIELQKRFSCSSFFLTLSSGILLVYCRRKDLSFARMAGYQNNEIWRFLELNCPSLDSVVQRKYV